MVKVFIAVDGSEPADRAFNWYLENLHTDGNEVIIGHICEPPIQPSFAFRAGLALPPEQWNMMAKEMEQENHKLKEKYCGVLKEKNINCSFHKGEGTPGHHICDLLKKDHIELAVLGTRGKGTVRRTILGSVSDYVLHHAHIPVVICRN